MARGFSGRLAELLRVIMRSEHLDDLPEASCDLPHTPFITTLLKPESLPFDEEPRGGRRPGPASGIFASEPLPIDDAPGPRGGRTSFVATLFSREALPVDPPPGPGPAGRGPGR